MYDLIFGYQVTQIIRAFADLSLADHLADGPLTAAQVAAREASAPDATFRLMRAGAALGLLTVDPGHRFHTTALLDTLRTDAPVSLRSVALGMTNRACWLPWCEFTETVRRGQTQAGRMLGTGFFSYLRRHPAQSREFTAAMEAVTSLWSLDVARVIDTRDVQLAVDVGGANGALLRELQKANPRLRGIVFDRPDVAGEVAAAVASGEFAHRTEVVGGDFFVRVPAADLYLLKFVLHDWSDERCVEILTRCREAMAPDGRVAIIEFLVSARLDGWGHPSMVALMDLSMLAVAEGKERSLEDYDTLLWKAGLRRIAVRRLSSPQSVIEAVAG
nr:methyltransferase [Mycobacterium paraense]